MPFDKGVQNRFKLGAALEFIGIIAVAAALMADVGGAAVILLGGAAIVIGAALQVWAVVTARRS